ncbi:Ser/Thr protein kinase RdoA involved in Cpx stress response, MazF antagonist [Paenibacillus sp. GP183]|nr:Ser/Thr protein kinase RdoA involved in Cpx stress response, MazF antagonist [Paenibacillus sp. GP183]
MMITDADLEQEFGIHILKQVRVRDVFQIHTLEHGVLCLKSYAISEPEIDMIVQVMLHLAENGFLQGPRIHFTLSGCPWITRDEVHYMLTNWVIGENPDFGERKLFKKAIRLLARFHSIAQSFPAEHTAEERIKFHKLQKRITASRDMLAEQQGMERFVSLCNKAMKHLDNPIMVKALTKEQDDRAFVHGDYNYPNLVLDTSGTLHMIDFENTSLHVRMEDFSHMLHRNYPWQGKEICHWIEYYDRKRPLSNEDLHILYTLLLVPYPIIRSLKSHNRNTLARMALPSKKQVRTYRKELKSLL